MENKSKMPSGIYKRSGVKRIMPRHKAFIKANCLRMSASAMDKKFKFHRGAFGRWMRQNGIKVPKKLRRKWRSENMRMISSATPAEDRFLKKNYLTMPSKRMAGNLKRADVFIRTRLRQLGLVIPRHIIDQRIQGSRIKPGHVPLNKGKKMSKAMYKKCAPTMFRKGNLPINTLHDGAITIHHNHKERGAPPYKWIRLSKANWEMLHVHNWKKKHGPIPTGFLVAFKTKNTMNCKPSNLKLITRKENMLRNTIHRYPEDLKKTIMTLGYLKRKINTLTKNGKKQNQ